MTSRQHHPTSLTYSHRKFKQKTFACKKCETIHVSNYCPAYVKNCKTCKRYNHFTRQCFYNKRVHENEIETDDSENKDRRFFCDTITIHSITEDSDRWWYSLLKIDDKTVKFKLDTGAEANVIPQSLIYKLPNNQLKGLKTKLSTYRNNLVKSLGKTKLTCGTKTAGIKQDLEFYVVGENDNVYRPYIWLITTWSLLEPMKKNMMR